ncbi:MAG TPA: nucleotidyl transferase AbiEii/AbiGii toxin family protein [bacterium]|nr:nucleotidyl transferase AbiEii/AbiGii toxin family protein [bacterium]
MDQNEELLARIMNFLAEKFKNQLVLKGGMLLRLWNLPRSTQDLDYVWLSSKSRKVFAQEVKRSLGELEGVDVTGLEINSRGIFLDLIDSAKRRAKIEINVEKSTYLPPKPASTAPLASRHSLPARIVATMDPAEALSHKIAAALERDLIRDLYDLAQMEALTAFDAKTLEARLSRLEISRAKPRKVNRREAASLLREKAAKASPSRIETELAGIIPTDQMAGLDLWIRAAASRIAHRIETLGTS